MSGEYNPMDRCGQSGDEDASMLIAIEVAFAIPVEMTQEHQRRLVELIDDLTSSPWNQPQNGVHWMAGMGSKPQWSKSDAAFLGIPAEADAPKSGEPTFNSDIFFIETSAREFVSEKERDRKTKQRSKRELTTDELARLLDNASMLIARLCSRTNWGKSEQCRTQAMEWLKKQDLLPSPTRDE